MQFEVLEVDEGCVVTRRGQYACYWDAVAFADDLAEDEDIQTMVQDIDDPLR